jgi:hypothetical protein
MATRPTKGDVLTGERAVNIHPIVARLVDADLLEKMNAHPVGAAPAAGAALMRNRAGNFSVGHLFEFLTALGQDVKITVKPTRKEQGAIEVVAG